MALTWQWKNSKVFWKIIHTSNQDNSPTHIDGGLIGWLLSPPSSLNHPLACQGEATPIKPWRTGQPLLLDHSQTHMAYVVQPRPQGTEIEPTVAWPIDSGWVLSFQMEWFFYLWSFDPGWVISCQMEWFLYPWSFDPGWMVSFQMEWFLDPWSYDPGWVLSFQVECFLNPWSFDPRWFFLPMIFCPRVSALHSGQVISLPMVFWPKVVLLPMVFRPRGYFNQTILSNITERSFCTHGLLT